MHCSLLSNIILLISYNMVYAVGGFTVKPQEAPAFSEPFPSLGRLPSECCGILQGDLSPVRTVMYILFSLPPRGFSASEKLKRLR